jgi:DNA-binding NarL/FixJ family response regulator
MAIQVAIVEDNPELLNNLRLILSYYSELTVVGAYPDAEQFMQALQPDSLPQVVIMDINLPGISGIKTVERVKLLYPQIQFLMCTIYEDEENIYQSLCAGAAGYVMKNTPPEKFLEAIRDIYNGGSPMSPNIARKVVVSFQQRNRKSDDYENLTEREKQLLDLLAKGYRYKEIAAELFISLETVRTHIRNIYDKLQVNSRTEALNKVRV